MGISCPASRKLCGHGWEQSLRGWLTVEDGAVVLSLLQGQLWEGQGEGHMHVGAPPSAFPVL